MTSSQPRFEYDRAPDFTALMKQRQAEDLEGLERAEQQARRNDEARIENAKQFDKMVEGIGKFSRKAKVIMEDQRDKRDQKLKNRGQAIHAQTGATWSAMQAHNKAWEEGNKEAGYWNSLAAKAREEGNTTLALELENLTGHKERILKQLLLKNAAVNYKDNLAKAKETYKATLEDGTTLGYGQIKTQEEFDTWLTNYNIDQGFNDTSWAKTEFLSKNFYPTYTAAVTAAKSEWNKVATADLKNERESGYRTQLELAAKTNTLGETVYNLIQSEGGYYTGDGKGASGIREHLRDELIKLLETDEIDPSEFDSLYNFKFKRNDGTEVDLSNWEEFDQDKIREKVLDARIKDLNNLKKEEQVAALTYEFQLKDQIQKEGRRVTEKEAREIEQNFKDAFPDQVVPEYIKSLNTRTQEDRADDDIIDSMQAKLDRGEAIGDEWMQIKGSEELKEEWRKKAESALGKGLDPTHTSQAFSDLEAVLKDTLEMTQGVLETDTPEFLLMRRNAQNMYAKHYREAKFETNEERHGWAYQQTVDAIKNNPHQLNRRGKVTLNQSYAHKVTVAEADLKKSAENGIDIAKTRLIKGTENDYALLENYAKDPANNILPNIYKQLARNPAFQKRGVTAWSLANDQYFSQTGKELPKPNSQLVYEGKSPIVQYLLTRYPSSRTLRQAVVHDSNSLDFSHSDTLNPELVTQ